jgi:Tfp pilus assembly protein PilO
MSRNDRMILLVIPVIAAVIAFWFLVLAPKQDKASQLDTQVTQLQSDVQTQQQAAQEGQQARKSFPRDYQRLVVMGKAVPVDDETASLIVQVNKIAERSGVSFRAIDLSQGGSSAAAAAAVPATPAPTTPAPTSSDSSTTTSDTASSSDTSSGSTSTSASPTTTPALPTEGAASLLPIGASVGSANLPILPYSMTFRGSYFQIADFMAGIDGLVKTGKSTIQADGRLATIDGFTLAPPQNGPPGALDANLAITTYVTPASQGLTAGATPAGPAPTEPASSTPPTATATPTSAPATP